MTREYSEHRLDSAAQLADKAINLIDSMDRSVSQGLKIQRQQLNEILFEYK